MSEKTTNLLTANELLQSIWPNKKTRPSLRWLRDRIKAGDIPAVRSGRLLFFDPVDVIDKLKNPGKQTDQITA